MTSLSSSRIAAEPADAPAPSIRRARRHSTARASARPNCRCRGCGRPLRALSHSSTVLPALAGHRWWHLRCYLRLAYDTAPGPVADA